MKSGLATRILVTLFYMFIVECSSTFSKNGVEVVTYGDPCVITRCLPIEIQGPKAIVQEEKIPVSLNFRIVSDMFVRPRKIEYPIKIETPCATSSASEMMIKEDVLRGKTYAYNTYVPSTPRIEYSEKNYNYAIDVPVPSTEVTERCEEKYAKRLKGLKSRIDRVLVPACEVSSSSHCSCQC